MDYALCNFVFVIIFAFLVLFTSDFARYIWVYRKRGLSWKDSFNQSIKDFIDWFKF